MKKKITIGIFVLLLLLTVIAFVVIAVNVYNSEIVDPSGLEIHEDGVAIFILIVGGFVLLGETDLFFTLYYFLVKKKTQAKTRAMIFSHLAIFILLLSDLLSRFLGLYVSRIFGEEIIVIATAFFIYVTTRVICVSICYMKKPKPIIVAVLSILNAVFFALMLQAIVFALPQLLGVTDSCPPHIYECYVKYKLICIILAFVALIAIILAFIVNVKLHDRLNYSKRTWQIQYISATILTIPMMYLWDKFFHFLFDVIN